KCYMYSCVYTVYIQWGKKVFEPLPISQVWPLAKKCVIYNCNSRCILTVMNRISTNKSRKLHFITFMTLFVVDSENKYLNPQANSNNSGSQSPVMCPRSTQISPH